MKKKKDTPTPNVAGQQGSDVPITPPTPNQEPPLNTAATPPVPKPKERLPFTRFLSASIYSFLFASSAFLLIVSVFFNALASNIDLPALGVIESDRITGFLEGIIPIVFISLLLVAFFVLIILASKITARKVFQSLGSAFLFTGIISIGLSYWFPYLASLISADWSILFSTHTVMFQEFASFCAMIFIVIGIFLYTIFAAITKVKYPTPKKSRAYRITQLVLFVLIAITCFVAWNLFLSPLLNPTASDLPTQAVQDLSEIAQSSACIDFDEDSGILYRNNEIIVFIDTNASQSKIDALFADYDVTPDDAMAEFSIYQVQLKEAMSYDDLQDLVDDFKEEDIVDDAYINVVSTFSADANEETDETITLDPIYPTDAWNGASWNLAAPRNENWGMEAIDAPVAWAYLDQLSTVKVGLIDSMPDTAHKDLTFANTTSIFADINTHAINYNKYTVPADDHGTHVAGIMAANWGDESTDKKNVNGVIANKAELYYSAAYSSSDNVITNPYYDAYTYSLAINNLLSQGVQVINISQNTNRLIGFAASRGNKNAIEYLSLQADLMESILLRIIESKQANNQADFVICVAAGNNNAITYYKDDSEPYGYRTSWNWNAESGDAFAKYNNFLNLIDDETVKSRIVVVGSVGMKHTLWMYDDDKYTYSYFSNVGDRVDVVAPGEDVYSSIVGNKYDLMNGTSMSTPHVAGVAGLIFAANPDLTGPEVKDILITTAQGRYYYTGGSSGMVNAGDAVKLALESKETPVDKLVDPTTSTGLDVCFVIDSTGSMGDDIDNAKENMTEILTALSDKAENYRVALIDYRDYASRTGTAGDYPYKVQLDFTNDNEAIIEAINGLDLGYGGDNEETVYAGLMAAAALDWEENATKIIILLGDAAPLDPEPTSGYTYDSVLSALLTAGVAIDEDKSDGRVLSATTSPTSTITTLATSSGDDCYLTPILFASGDTEDADEEHTTKNDTDTSEETITTPSVDGYISIFSIGVSSSASAATFFEDIASATGGIYSSIDHADEVSSTITSSIEQIEIIELVTIDAKFGSAMANTEINLYDGREYLFSFTTDEDGCATIDSVEVASYKWTSDTLYPAGTLKLEAGTDNATVTVSETYWFIPILEIWQQQRVFVLAGFVIYLLLCNGIAPLAYAISTLFKPKGPKPPKHDGKKTAQETTTSSAPSTPVMPVAPATPSAPPVPPASPVPPAPVTAATPAVTTVSPSPTAPPVATFCNNCGGAITPGQKFCKSCGQPLN